MQKTPQMLQLERQDPEGRDIRALIAGAYHESRTLEGAAATLGITTGALCRWIADLGGWIEKEVRFADCPAEDAAQEAEGVAA